MTGDMTVPGKLAALHCCKERFLFAYIGGNLLPGVVVCLVFLVADVEKLSETLVLKGLDSSLRVSSQCPTLTPIKENGNHKRLEGSRLRQRQGNAGTGVGAELTPSL